MTSCHDVEQPSPVLVRHRDRLPKGRALDVAMGYGRHARYLAEAGWDVDGIERDPEAVAAVEADARRRGLPIRVIRADLGTYALPVAVYDLVICFFYLDRGLIPQLRQAVTPGGVIVYETFSIENHRRFGKPGRTEFCLQPNELLSLFSGFEVLEAREGLVDGQYLASLVARRTESMDG